MYWNMKRDEQRRARKQRQASSKTSFDDLVTKEGNLKKEEVDADVRSSTATEVKEGEDGLRRRNERHKESAGSTTIANPFADQNESQVLFDRSLIDISNEPRSTHSRSSTATLPTEHSILPTQPESPIRTAPTIQPAQPPAPREQQLVDTSSSSSSRSSSHHHHHTPSNYQSVNEWASSTFPSFYEVPHEVPHSASHSTSPLTSNTTTPQIASIHSSVAPSLADSGEDIGADSSIDGGEEGRYMDILSEAGISTPGSWTEVGSEVSEEDHGA